MDDTVKIIPASPGWDAVLSHPKGGRSHTPVIAWAIHPEAETLVPVTIPRPLVTLESVIQLEYEGRPYTKTGWPVLNAKGQHRAPGDD